MKSETRDAPAVPDPSVPAFLVGVTGYMELDAEQASLVAGRLRLVYRFLRQGGAARDPDEPSRTLATSLARLAVSQASPETPTQLAARKTYEETFAAWPGLGDIPVAVMTNLAPGVDSIATEVALEPEFRDAGFHVRAPLPFPAEVYREASTFVGDDVHKSEARQRRFDGLIEAIGADNAFPVRLQRDVDPQRREENWPPQRWVEKTARERDEERPEPTSASVAGVRLTPRRQRYYAAGEFLAVTSHLLIAVWDGTPGDPPGTASIVRARLEGPTSDLLTTSQGIRQPPGGPALHLYATRPGEERSPSLPAARLLHPAENAADEEPGETLLGERQGGWIEPKGDDERKRSIEERNRHALALQRDRFAVFCRIADNLRDFAECPPFPGRKECEADYAALLKHKEHDFHPEIRAMRMEGETLPEGAEGEFSRALRRMSYLRFKATKASRALKDRHDGSLRTLFLLTLLAATLLHFFAHWHVHGAGETHHAVSDAASESGDAHAAPHGAEATDPDAEAGGESKHDAWPKIAFGTIAALLAAGTLLYFFLCRMRQDAERHHDYRALAEGVRVQFYWNLAGLGQSVSANYMHRQRSELDWIRAAIRSVAMPYEDWRERFLRLPRASQIVALDCVRTCWIEVQRDYFHKSWHDKRHTLHAWHKVGAALALAGVGLVTLCVAEAWGLPPVDVWTMLAAPVLAALLWCGVMLFRGWTGDLRETAHGHAGEKDWVQCVHWLAPAPEHRVLEYRTPVERASRALVGFLARLPLALILVYVTYELTRQVDVQGLYEYGVPVGKEWRVILGGVGLLAGALAVAWSEKNLLSELSYQYNTMDSLFRDAARRMTADLKELERLEPSSTGEYERKLDEVHEYLYALGKEALDENAEWLLLHRARPLEPVMAG